MVLEPGKRRLLHVDLLRQLRKAQAGLFPVLGEEQADRVLAAFLLEVSPGLRMALRSLMDTPALGAAGKVTAGRPDCRSVIGPRENANGPA